MSDATTIFWFTVMMIGFVGSAVYSGLETGIYRLNRVRLHLLDHKGQASARTIRKLIAAPTVLLTTLLIGNNVANYLGTASLAVIMDHWGVGQWRAILLNTLIVTPILFVFGETLPKDLFAGHSDRLTYPLAPVLEGSRRLFTWTGFVPLITGFTSQLTRLIGADLDVELSHPRRVVESLVKEGVGHGLLTHDQSAIVERVLAMTERTVADEMTPWDKVAVVRLDDSYDSLRRLAAENDHEQFPVVDAAGKVVGQIKLLDVLCYEPADCPPIDQLMAPVHTMKRDTPLAAALTTMRQQHLPLAVILDEKRPNRPLGLATMKDLVEPITGELVEW